MFFDAILNKIEKVDFVGSDEAKIMKHSGSGARLTFTDSTLKRKCTQMATVFF